MNAQPNNPQTVVYNINNTNGNNYVNHAVTATTAEAARAECPKEHAKSQNKVCTPLLSRLDADAQNNVTRLTDTFHTTSNNQKGFDELKTVCTLDDAQSPNKEPMAGMTQSNHVTLITHQEDSILDSYNNSTNKTPTNEDAATETNPTIQPDRPAQFRTPVKTTEEGVVVLHGSLIPYVKSSLNVAHVIQYWSYYAHILPGNNLSVFPALTEDNIQDFIDRLNII